MMVIPGYTYITHKLVDRPWGPECRFTVARPDGRHVNETAPVASMAAAEADVVSAITARLAVVDVEVPIE